MADDTASSHVPAAPASTGDALSLDRFVGKVPVAICFAGRADSPRTRELVRGFDDHLADFGRSRMQALIVVDDDAEAIDRHLPHRETHVPILADVDGTWREQFEVGDDVADDRAVTTVLLDDQGRLIDTVLATPGGVHAEEVLELASQNGLID